MDHHEVMIDVTGFSAEPGLEGPLAMAATVHLPDDRSGGRTVVFGYPGGGFGRRYYDIRTLPGYSQAEYHVARGRIFVACDHLGVGDSSLPDTLALTYENLAAANHIVATTVLSGLRRGTLVERVGPIAVERTVGLGQSMGGCLLTVQQGRHRTFDGVGFLGWSGIHTNFPAPDGSRLTYPMPPRGTDLRPVADQILGNVAPDEAHFRYCFHWPDEDPALLEADLASYRPFAGLVRGDERTPWGSSTVPACAVTMMTEGSVAAEAASIEVPVLAASGEVDVVPDPWLEPTAYRSSHDVSVVVVPRMAHMHNFAHTREQLWHRIESFIEAVPVSN